MRSGRVWALAIAIFVAHHHELRAADCNRNGSEDATDIAAGVVRDCNQNGVPDECDIEAVNLGLEAGERMYQGSPPLALSVRDFDGDGQLDIAVALLSLDGFLYWTKNPFGTHTPRQQLRLPDEAHAIDAADLDGDADLDVVLGGMSSVMVLENKGQAFELGPVLLQGTGIRGVAAADLDGDGDIDIAAATETGLTLLFRSDAWRFDAAGEFPVGSEPLDVAAVDLDGDLDADVVTVNALDNVSVFIQEGGGAFSEPRNHAAGREPRTLTPADIDGDGDIDLVVAGAELSILFNSGGKFPDRIEIPSVKEPRSAAVADLDLDGDLDIAAGGLSLALNQGGGSFARAKWSGATAFPGFIAAADLDGQGGVELIAAVGHELSVQIFGATLIDNSRDVDRDGIPDECQGTFFYRGDSSQDGVIDLADAVTVLRYLFEGGEEPACLETADVENDGQVGLADAVLILSFLFLGGPPPARPGPPGPPCGHDPDPPGSAGALGCESYPSCPPLEGRRF